MQPAKVLVELRRVLQPEVAPYVMSALTEEKHVWEALQQPEFLESILSDDCCLPEAWSPAALALRPLNNRINFSDLTAENIPGVEGSLRKQSLEILENTMRNALPPENLMAAGLLALALRERRRKTQSWRGFLGELTATPAKSTADLIEIWQTPLACLYGIIPDKWEFLESLLPQDAMHPAIDWVSHIILSDPLDPESQAEKFHDLMTQLVVDYQVEWLRYLAGKGRFALVAGVADHLLTSGHEFLNTLEEDFNPNHSEWVVTSRKLLDYQLAATLYQFSGRPLQAGVYLDKTRGLLQHWLVGSTMQMANVIDRDGKLNEDVHEEYAHLIEIMPVSDQLKNEAIMMAGRNRGNKSANNLLQEDKSAYAQIINSSSDKKNVIAKLITDLEVNPDLLKGQFVFDQDPISFLDTLIDQGLEDEAVILGGKYLENRTEDIRLIEWLANTCHKLGRDSEAINYCYQLILKDPQNSSHLRHLASLYEDRQDWKSAMEERRHVLQVSPSAEIGDKLALSACAIQAGDFAEVYTTCESILSENPDDGMAYTLMGKANLAQGEVDKAIGHLSRAVVIIPEEYSPWFELAEAYNRKGEPQKVVETLREAVLTAPASAELHYALGKAYLDTGQISDALPFLRQSGRLDPESIEISLALAESLLSLGYKPEAMEVVKRARTKWRVHPGLAYLHAIMLLKDGNKSEGLAVLDVAIKAENPQAEWFTLFAQTLLGDTLGFLTGESYAVDEPGNVQAINALEKATTIQPTSILARILTAEAHLIHGDNIQAFDAYHKLIEMPEAVQDEWYWRTQAGLGRSALNIGQTETALASLQNAVTANPDCIGLQQYLAEAFIKCDLLESAADTAEQALALAPENANNLSWYAGIMAQTQQAEKAVAALRSALEINPEAVDLQLRLSEILLGRGDQEAARVELAGVVENSQVTGDHLKKAAHVYLQVEDSIKALSVLEKAVNELGLHDAQTLFELAVLYKTTGKTDPALNTIQQSIQADNGYIPSHLLLAEIQEKFNRPQAAIAALEQALSLANKSAGEKSGKPSSALSQFDFATSPADIHIAITQLQQKLGNFSDALAHAVKAVELQPDSQKIRFEAADMAAKLMQNDLALKLIQNESLDSIKDSDDEIEPVDPWTAGMCAMRTEHALECGDQQAAGRWVDKGRKFDPQNMRLAAAKVILLARSGQWQEADETFAELRTEINSALKIKLIRSVHDNRRVTIPDGTLLAAAEAAVEISRWSDANQLLEHVIRKQSNQPLGLFRQARTMVRAAEWYFTGAKIGSINHLPDEYVTSEDAYQHFEQIVSDFKKASDSSEIERWKIRGEAVFHPSTTSIRGFAAQALAPDDAAALVMALNRVGNSDGARQVGEQYAANALVNVQLALIDGNDDQEVNQKTASRAVSLMPTNPICHAALAAAADNNGDIGRALEAIETALIFWKNESGWQYWAAKLAMKSNEIDAARQHLEKTHALMPANLDVALELGAVYQTLSEGPQAVAILQKAVQIAPTNSAAWLAFARALHLNRQSTDALKAAAQAAQHGGNESYKALVLSGEILLALGEEKKAMEYARQAEKLAPMHAETRLLSCKILAARGKEKEALGELNRAIDDLPGVLDLEMERARLVSKLHGPGAVSQVMQPLVDKYPENDQVVGMFAKAMAESGKIAEAEKFALQALRINANKADMHLLLGKLFTHSGQLDKAVHHLSESAQLAPDQPEAYLELGNVYTVRRDFPQALAAFQQAINCNPEDFRPYYQAGLILRDGKDYRAAENMLRRAANLAPNDVNIRRQLGAIVALNLVHNCQEANSCL